MVFTVLLVAPAGAAVIGFNPMGPYTSLNTGDLLSVEVVVSGLGTEVVSAYDLDILFDPLMLTPMTITQYLVLGDDTLFEAFYSQNIYANYLDIAGVSLLSDSDLATLQAGGDVTLAKLDFEAIMAGDTSLSFSWGPGQDVKGRNNVVLIPSSVPEPSTLLLLGAGIAGIAAWRRKRALG